MTYRATFGPCTNNERSSFGRRKPSLVVGGWPYLGNWEIAGTLNTVGPSNPDSITIFH